MLAAIIERAPDWDAAASAPAPRSARLLRRCLDKDPKQRLRDIGDARVEIEDARTPAAAPSAETTSSPKSARLPWLVAAAASIVALLSVASAWLFRPAPVESLSPRFSRIVPVTTGPARELGPDISPDGKWVAYISNLDGQPDVWVKFLAGGEAANLTASAGLEVSASHRHQWSRHIAGRHAHRRHGQDPREHGAICDLGDSRPRCRGVPRKLLDDGFLGMRWAPDGREITFIRAGAAAGDALWVADGGWHQPARNHPGARRHPHPLADLVPRRLHLLHSHDHDVSNLDQAEIYRIDSRGGAAVSSRDDASAGDVPGAHAERQTD